MAIVKELDTGLQCEVIFKKEHGVDFRIELPQLRKLYNIDKGSDIDVLIRMIARFRSMAGEKSVYVLFSDLQRLALSGHFRHDNDRCNFLRLMLDIEQQLENMDGYSVTVPAEEEL